MSKFKIIFLRNFTISFVGLVLLSGCASTNVNTGNNSSPALVKSANVNTPIINDEKTRNKEREEEKESWTNKSFMPKYFLWAWWASDPIFKTRYPTELVKYKPDEECDSTSAVTELVPKGTYLRQSSSHENDPTDNIMVNIYQIPKSAEADEQKANSKFLSSPFLLCTENEKINSSPEHFTRVGGLGTGVLVVPFKIRSGDIYSDSTIGPYVSYSSSSKLNFLASFGLSQVSTVPTGQDTIKNETGLTFAMGAKFTVRKNWDIALIAGADHLSGQAGDDWQYQDKLWWSLAIGFNFSK